VSTRRLTAAALVAGLPWAATPGLAAAYTAEYVFGDSLSDRGNLAEVYYQQNLPYPPSFHDSFTNGNVAVQVLAQSLGLNADPSLWVTGFRDVHNLFGGASYVPGTNYAVAAATSASQAVGGPAGINLPQQVAAYNVASAGRADPNALYTVFIGGNDVRNAALQGTGTAAVLTGVTTEVGAVAALATAGARNFLVVNVPNVGFSPEFRQDHPAVAPTATALSQQYDAVLAQGLAAQPLPPGTNLFSFDLYSYDALVRANAAQFGITNTTDRCFVATPFSAAATPQCGPNGANIASFAYWDSIHPTATMHALWGQGFERLLAGDLAPSPVPEPPSAALLGAGLLAVGGLARGRRSRETTGP